MSKEVFIELVPILCVTITAGASIFVAYRSSKNALKLEEQRALNEYNMNIDIDLRSKRNEILLSWYNILNGTCVVKNSQDEINERISGFLTPTTKKNNVKIIPLSDLLQQTLIYTDDQNIVVLISILMAEIAKNENTTNMSKEKKQARIIEKGRDYSVISSMIFKRLLKKWNNCDVNELFVLETTLKNDLSEEEMKEIDNLLIKTLQKLKY